MEKIYESDGLLVVAFYELDLIVIGSYYPPRTYEKNICDGQAFFRSHGVLMKKVIVAGNFNSRLDKVKNDMREVTFLAALETLHHLRINATTEPTYYSYIGTSVINLIFCNSAVQIRNSHINRSDITKHAQIKMAAALKCSKRFKRCRAIGRLQMEDFEEELTALLIRTSESCLFTSTTCLNKALEKNNLPRRDMKVQT